MPISALTGLYIDQTYPRLVQTQGGEFADGLGTTLTLITSTGSLLTTASIVNNSNIIRFTKGNGSTFDITVNTGSGGSVSGDYVTTASFNAFTSSYNTGSFTGSFTGSLFGTASWANNALTASYITASRVVGTVTSASYAITASYVETAQTASYILASNVDGTVASASYALSSNPGYLSFVANLTYDAGNGTFNNDVFVDTIGITAFSRSGAGIYYFEGPDFPLGKTWIMINQNQNQGVVTNGHFIQNIAYRFSISSIRVETNDINPVNGTITSSDLLNNLSIEVRIYP